MTVGNNETYRFSARLSGEAGQDIMNVWFIKTTFSTTETDQDFVDAVLLRLKNAYSAFNTYMSSLYDAVDIKVEQVSWTGGKLVIDRNVGTYDWPAGFEPADAANNLPSGASLLVKYRTSGVRTLVRKFFSGITETHSDGIAFTSAMMTVILDAFDDFIVQSSVSGTNYIDFVVHSFRANSWLTYLSCIVSGIAAYQRRRRAGAGS